MPMIYEELDETTRKFMLEEFQADEQAIPYRSKALTSLGLDVFPDLMRRAIEYGSEVSLMQSLNNPEYWEPYETYVRGGVERERKRNIGQAAERLALTEFNTWYVRGLARRLIEEGIEECQIYRGAQPKWEHGECSQHEGMIVKVQVVYDGHRGRYWPEPGDPSIFSIPAGPGCHHVIKRVTN